MQAVQMVFSKIARAQSTKDTIIPLHLPINLVECTAINLFAPQQIAPQCDRRRAASA